MEQPPNPLMLNIPYGINTNINSPLSDPTVTNYKNSDMERKKKGQLFKICFLATIAYALLSNHITFKIADNLYSLFTAKHNIVITEEGLVTPKGTLILSLIFFIVMFLIMFK